MNNNRYRAQLSAAQVKSGIDDYVPDLGAALLHLHLGAPSVLELLFARDVDQASAKNFALEARQQIQENQLKVLNVLVQDENGSMLATIEIAAHHPS